MSLGIFLGSPFSPDAFGEVDFEEIGQLEADQIISEAVLPYIRALQAGDVLTLEGLVDGKLAITLEQLLKQNTEYPAFLRQRYGGTTVRDTIQIFQRPAGTSSALDQEGGQRIAGVSLETPAGVQKDFQLSLAKDAQGAWKIIDQKYHR